jgi:hypothetical protein
LETIQTLTNWTTWQKIFFRFFFVFFIFETLTELVTGNWFGSATFIWTLGETIYTRPMIWLNNHFFHFPYKPEGNWTILTASLVLIRHIVFLVSTISICLLWTIFDGKAKNYDKLNFWFSKILRIVLACTIFAYGIIKVFPDQMPMPTFVDLHKTVGELTPFDLLWDTFGYGKPYQIVSGIFEVLSAILILFRRTLVVGLMLSLVIMANVVLLNYTFIVGVLDLSFLLLLFTLYLLCPYFSSFYSFFLKGQNASLKDINYSINTKWKKIILSGLAIILIGTSFSLNTIDAYKRYAKVEAVNKSRKYSEIKTFVSNNDTLKLVVGDNIRWRFWSERIMNEKLLVTLATMDIDKSKSYELNRDSINHLITLKPVYQEDTTVLTFQYKDIDKTNWHLEGNLKDKHLSVDLQKINPDTVLNLLKAKRTILGKDGDN